MTSNFKLEFLVQEISQHLIKNFDNLYDTKTHIFMIMRGLASWIWSIRVVTKCIWDPWRQPTNLDLEGDQLWFVTPNFVKCQMLAPTYIDTRVLTQEFEGYILQIKSPKNWPIQANVRCWFKELTIGNWKGKQLKVHSFW